MMSKSNEEETAIFESLQSSMFIFPCSPSLIALGKFRFIIFYCIHDAISIHVSTMYNELTTASMKSFDYILKQNLRFHSSDERQNSEFWNLFNRYLARRAEFQYTPANIALRTKNRELKTVVFSAKWKVWKTITRFQFSKNKFHP